MEGRKFLRARPVYVGSPSPFHLLRPSVFQPQSVPVDAPYVSPMVGIGFATRAHHEFQKKEQKCLILQTMNRTTLVCFHRDQKAPPKIKSAYFNRTSYHETGIDICRRGMTR